MTTTIADFRFLMVARRNLARQPRLSHRYRGMTEAFGRVGDEKKSGSAKQRRDFSARKRRTGLDFSRAASDHYGNTPVVPLLGLVHSLLSDVHQGRVSFLRQSKPLAPALLHPGGQA